MSPKYPLDALEALRTRRAETRAQRLAEESARAERAQASLAQAEANRDAALARRTQFEAEQAERLDAGLMRAADLAGAAEVRRTLSQAEVRFGAECDAGREQLERARAARLNAASAFERARSEQEAVERHHATWSRALQDIREQTEDEQALERWSSERFGLPRR